MPRDINLRIKELQFEFDRVYAQWNREDDHTRLYLQRTQAGVDRLKAQRDEDDDWLKETA